MGYEGVGGAKFIEGLRRCGSVTKEYDRPIGDVYLLPSSIIQTAHFYLYSNPVPDLFNKKLKIVIFEFFLRNVRIKNLLYLFDLFRRLSPTYRQKVVGARKNMVHPVKEYFL